VNSDLRYAYRATLERQLRDHPEEYAIVKLSGPVIRAVQDVVEEHIDLYGSAGKAHRS
jgi:fructose/tagatose bisphosphate aldolase